ncbi:hypothetical protein [Lactococcus cremoris]|uniref:Phage protein n=1 Tax=Lactococcus lactis subsp. cremoris TaxID=1359 RepID=A0ABR5EFK3_LACLC|nr:hypothetical protein [Lactococcus cremoris]KKW71197.1 hypothetical protein VN93_1860 [Lactococcus cremoris]TNU75008.1 hypothetical protein FIB60_13405 [Lactococcus cremoris]
MIGIVTAVFSSSVISTLLTLAGGYFIVNKKAADYTNELAKKKKIAEIYYEERAKVLQELYILLVNRPSDIVNLLKFLKDSAMEGVHSYPQVYHDLYKDLIVNEDKFRKTLLNSSLYLKDEDYMTIKDSRTYWGPSVSLIVDLFSLYKKVPNVNTNTSFHTAEFKEFSSKALKINNIDKVIEKYTKATVDIEEIADIIKKTIASNEIL